MKRLREELLDAAGASDGLFIFVTQFVNTEDRDDVLQIFVALQGLLDTLCNAIVLFAQNVGVENARGGCKRVDSRIDTEL